MCARSALSQSCLQHLIACMCAGMQLCDVESDVAGSERSEPPCLYIYLYIYLCVILHGNNLMCTLKHHVCLLEPDW